MAAMIAGATAPAASASSARKMRVAVILMRLPKTTAEPVSKASVQASTFGSTNSVADWYSQMSGGQVAVTGKVYGYYGGVRSCDLLTEIAAGEAAAAHDGYVASDYDNVVVFTPEQGCDFAGMGWIGESGVFLNGDASPGLMEHELGHNLGLSHAGEYTCGVAPVAPGCLGDYSDPTDVMGDSYFNRGFSAEHKYKLGWIPAAEVRTVTTGTQIISLTASENPIVAGSIQLIHVRAADGTLFAIDRRASVGYDTGLSGVWIRRVALVNSDDTELVRSRALAAGETFVDAAHKVTIKTLTDSGAHASIKVCVGACWATVAAQSGKRPGAIHARNIATASRSSSANSSITLTVPAGHGVASGHTVIVSTYASRVSGSVSCTDSRGNRYGANVNSLGTERLIVCSAHATTGLPPGATITVRYPAFNGSTVASANDFSGVRANARADKVSTRVGAGRAIDSGTAPRTSGTAELVFGVEIHRGQSTFASGPGYTRIGAVSHLSGSVRITLSPEFKVVSSMGAYKAGGTLSSAQRWRAAVITFFAA